jgi:DNA-directed RNA polymerase specialized sigma24 family protein
MAGTQDDTQAFNRLLKKVSQDTNGEFSYRTVQILKEEVGWDEGEIARRTGVPRDQINQMLTSRGRASSGSAGSSSSAGRK